MEVEIAWDDKAVLSIHKILNHIADDSPANAGKIVRAIEQTLEKIKKHPLIYPEDKYRKTKDKSYRAFELYRIRVSYKVETTRVLVVRCRHTKQKPLYY